jgi:hypothetical protein
MPFKMLNRDPCIDVVFFPTEPKLSRVFSIASKMKFMEVRVEGKYASMVNLEINVDSESLYMVNGAAISSYDLLELQTCAFEIKKAHRAALKFSNEARINSMYSSGDAAVMLELSRLNNFITEICSLPVVSIRAENNFNLWHEIEPQASGDYALQMPRFLILKRAARVN